MRIILAVIFSVTIFHGVAAARTGTVAEQVTLLLASEKPCGLIFNKQKIDDFVAQVSNGELDINSDELKNLQLKINRYPTHLPGMFKKIHCVHARSTAKTLGLLERYVDPEAVNNLSHIIAASASCRMRIDSSAIKNYAEKIIPARDIDFLFKFTTATWDYNTYLDKLPEAKKIGICAELLHKAKFLRLAY